VSKLFFTYIFTYSLLLSQTSISKFIHLTTDDGLSQSNLKNIVQDNLGFMWFGTADGLNKYDGYDFNTYKNDENDSTSISSNSIESIFIDSKGNIWIGTQNGLSLYNGINDNFKNFIYDENEPLGIGEGWVNSITEDKENNLWLAMSTGLNYFDIKNNRFLSDLGDSKSMSNGQPMVIFNDSKNNIWIGTENGGLNLLKNDKTFLKFPIRISKSESKYDYQIKSICEDGEGTIWIGTYAYGLSYLDPNNLSERSLPLFRHDNNNNNSLTLDAIVSLYPNKNVGIWLGTENGGVDFLSSDRNNFYHYKYDPNEPTNLNNNSIYSIFQDFTGDLWVGTFSGGINYVNNVNQGFRTYRNIPGNKNGLVNNTVRDFTEDSKGNIWIATDGGGLDMFDVRKGAFTHFNSLNSNLESDAVLDVCIDKDENIWIGTWGGGLNKLDRKNRIFSSFTKENSGLLSNNVFDIEMDKQGNLWLATTEGLSVYNPETEVIKTYLEKGAGILNSFYYETVAIDFTGKILVGASDGFLIFDPKTKTAISFAHDEKNKNSLSDKRVNSIFVENSTTYWIGTPNGLNKFDTKTKKFKNYFEKDGLPGNNIKAVEIDNSGFLWISTNRGISKFNTKNETFKNYSKSDGLQGNEYVLNSCFKAKDGKLLFGGGNGFDFFNPDEIKENTCIPPVIITDFQIFNKSLKQKNEVVNLSDEINRLEDITLSYKESVFSIHFTALNYRATEKNEYAYILKGFDKEWNYIGNKRYASYTNLDPGTYIFSVKASNNDGIWNEVGKSITVIITPPFWATWWFRVFSILAASALVYYLVNRAKHKRKALEEINKKLETEILHSRKAEADKLILEKANRKKDEDIKKTLQAEQDYLQNGFDLLLDKMSRFSEGDLSVKINIQSEDSFSRLFSGFNKAVENFRKIIVNIVNVVQATADASNVINLSTEKIFKGTTDQTTRSEKVFDAVKLMSVSISDNNTYSEKASKLSYEAKNFAEDGSCRIKETITGISKISEVVDNAFGTIQKLGESNKQIGEIVDLIDEIASQTNLLALNAAIEAARAGEHGRGFAVVADEVQKLSERTTNATKSIAEMIKRIQLDSEGAITSISTGFEKVNDGKKYAEQAGYTFKNLMKSVTDASETIEQVAASSDEQAMRVKNISEGISLINDVSKETTDRAYQVAATIEDLNKLTSDLQNLISNFDMGQEQTTIKEVLEYN